MILTRGRRSVRRARSGVLERLQRWSWGSASVRRGCRWWPSARPTPRRTPGNAWLDRESTLPHRRDLRASVTGIRPQAARFRAPAESGYESSTHRRRPQPEPSCPRSPVDLEEPHGYLGRIRREVDCRVKLRYTGIVPEEASTSSPPGFTAARVRQAVFSRLLNWRSQTLQKQGAENDIRVS